MSNEEINIAYARLLCIETNEIEGVFCLGGESLIRLVSGGFFIDAIQHVNPSSIIKDKHKIIKILENVQTALFKTKEWASDTKVTFTKNFIMSIHALIIRSDRVKQHIDNTTRIPYRVLVLTNEWRRKTVYARHKNGCIMFYPFDKVSKAMDEYINYVQPILENIKAKKINNKPYVLAAWIHHALVSIHPFEDGNGRTTRLISSIPLVLADLPPICISLESKNEYIATLQIADKTGNISPFAEFIAKESLSAIDKIRVTHNTYKMLSKTWEPKNEFLGDSNNTLSIPFASYMETETTPSASYMETDTTPFA